MCKFKIYIEKVTVACTFGCILQSLHANMKYIFFSLNRAIYFHYDKRLRSRIIALQKNQKNYDTKSSYG